MRPVLFEFPLLGDVPTTWPLFLSLLGATIALVIIGSSLWEKWRLLGRILVVVPLAAFVIAFATFVETPKGKIPVHAYGFFIMLGFVVGSWIAAKRSPQVGVSSEFTLDLALYVMIAGILGSRVFYVAQYRDEFAWAPFWRIFDVTDGGLDFWGGAVGWILPLAWYWWGSQDPERPKQGLLRALAKTLFACFAFGLLLGRIMYLIQQRHSARYDYGVFKIWEGGIVFYGGLFGAVAVAFWYIHRHRQSISVISDLFIPEVALGYASARIGCFLNGCCFGHPTDVPWAIRYPGPPKFGVPGSPAWKVQMDAHLIDPSAAQSLPVHPSQLYAVAAAVGIFFLLSRIWRTNKVPGRVLGWFLLVYPIYRFLAELTRGDELHDWFGLTISQFISVCMFAVGLAWLYILSRRVAPAPEPIAAVSDRR